jgi:hypothetical protein
MTARLFPSLSPKVGFRDIRTKAIGRKIDGAHGHGHPFMTSPHFHTLKEYTEKRLRFA